ncbi:hypothetical protein KC346_g76 [Hortaea werneckii]|nr:hypothetical protein KC346_g76 [Hortaea werneckii]
MIFRLLLGLVDRSFRKRCGPGCFSTSKSKSAADFGCVVDCKLFHRISVKNMGVVERSIADLSPGVSAVTSLDRDVMGKP